MDRLLLTRAGVELATFLLTGASTEVGSSPANAIRLSGPGVEPHNMVLRRRRRRWFAVARSGLLEAADGRRASTVPLSVPGAAVVVGPYVLRVESDGAVAEREPAGGRDRTMPALEPPAGPASGLLLRWAERGSLRRRVVATGTTTIGRADTCDLALDDPTVSEIHARLTVEGAVALIEDLASLNGTFLDGRRVHSAEIGCGGMLRLGGTEIECRPAGGAAAAARPGALCTPGLRDVFAAVRRAAPLREPVLLLGESGSGKDVMAGMLHAEGPRRSGPFVAVNCGALPRDLAESILYGHHRGAFTGAVESRRGAFQRAHGGTLFLDEIGEASLDIQAKLLRAIEEGEVLPVGAERPVPVQVRLVTATNRDLTAEARAGRFRWDLLHRLSVVVVRVPPLRSRPEDVVPLAEALLGALAPDVGCRRLSAGAVRRLERYAWPGNVRELRNVLVRAALETDDEEIAADRIAFDALAAASDDARGPRVDVGLEAVLRAHGGNVAAAAKTLGVPRTTLRDRIAMHRRCGA